MPRHRRSLLVLAVLVLGPAPSRADPPQLYVHPQKGQTEEQLEQDKEQCHEAQQAQLANYDRAYGACVEGRGYTER